MSSTNKHNAQISSANIGGGDLSSVNSLNFLYPDNNNAVANENRNYQNISQRQEHTNMSNDINTYDYSQNNTSQQFSQQPTRQQDNVVNTTRGLYAEDWILANNEKVQKYPGQLTQNNIINNSSNISYNQNLVDGNNFSKNELLFQTPNIYNQDLTADGVALTMEMERRARMNTAWYEQDANELSADYENKYNFLRNQIFDQTITLLNNNNVSWNKQPAISDFNVNQSERKLQAELKKEFVETKLREERNENKRFLQKNENVTTTINSNQVMGTKPQSVIKKPNIKDEPRQTKVVEEITRQEFMPKQVVQQVPPKSFVQDQPKVINKEVINETIVNKDPVINFPNNSQSFNQPTKSVTNKEVINETIVNKDPVINFPNNSPVFNPVTKSVTNKEKVENFVENFNKENALNEKLTAKDTIGVDLNQDFYISNDKLSNVKSYDVLTNGDKLETLVDNNKYIREDSLGYNILEKEVKPSQTNVISEENKTIVNNVEKENINKIQSLEEILKSLTNELLSVNNNAQASSNTLGNDKSVQSNTLQNKQNINDKEPQKSPLGQTVNQANTNATNFGGSSFQNNNVQKENNQINMIKPDLNANKPLFKVNSINEENLPKMIKPDVNANKPLFKAGMINNGSKK